MSGPLAPTPTAASALEQRFALDVQGVNTLRRAVRGSSEEGVRQVSRQFEALFMGMVLKSMREATPSSGLLDGQHTKMYLSMLDQQLAQHLSGRGVGLADAMYQQLGRTLGSDAAAAAGPRAPDATAPATAVPPAAPAAAAARAAAVRSAYAAPQPLPALHGGQAASAPAAPAATTTAPRGLPAGVQAFIDRLGDSARAAARATGLSEPLILAQAALESAWGRREVRGDDGSPSFNVFGIKADRSWRGPVTEATTTEVIDGAARKVRARFRAYASYEEAFSDYARFLTGNRRYGAVVGQADATRAAHELQRAGYATDPDYAQKLIRVMKRLVE